MPQKQPDDVRDARRQRAQHLRRKMIAIAGVGVVIIGALTLARDPGRNPSVVISAQPSAAPEAVSEPAPAAEVNDVNSSPRRPSRVAIAHDASVKTTPPPAASIPAAKLAVTPAPAPASTPIAAESSASVTTVVSNDASVTISGCLEMTPDGSEFRLTDTEGVDAPKSRGWRSGFLQKRNTPVALLPDSNSAGLRNYVGHRVSATGLLAKGTLTMRSFQPGTMCD